MARPPFELLAAVYSGQGRNLEFRQKLLLGDIEPVGQSLGNRGNLQCFGRFRMGLEILLKFLERLIKGELGSKTILAAVALVLLVVLQASGVITPEQFDHYTKLAEGLGLIGLRDALSKLKG